MKPNDVVGTDEIAALLGVKRGTVDQWRWRSAHGKLRPSFPSPTWELATGPVWRWAVVERWARGTGRLAD